MKEVFSKLNVLFVLLLCVQFGLTGCGGGGSGGDSGPPPPDLTGEWIGDFVANNPFYSSEIHFVISTQGDVNLEGVWIHPFYPGYVSGRAWLADGNSNWTVELDFFTEEKISCWTYFGNYTKPFKELDMLGYFENETVIDEEAYLDSACGGGSGGVLTVTRQPPP